MQNMDEVQRAVIADKDALRASVDHRDESMVHISDERISKVLVLRLIGFTCAFPRWDVSYCYVELKDGSRVRCDVECDQFTKNYKSELIEICKDFGIYGKGIGLFDAVETF